MEAVMGSQEWATILRCSVKTVEERLRSGDLPGEKFGGSWVIVTSAMLDRLHELTVEKMLERRGPRQPEATHIGHRGRQPPELPALN